ncbi:peptidase T [Ancylomarina euxinus]|uniref:Peptidase T n=1 Tax=Ancylomarina euxinus TaxID=2283627 RepID=A0A425Y0J4_9BACT|nr:peptidase T [Ancylomarina euxinus]MCZ4695269.1 peptidase T [Ancylomarina euxinus]MUP15466.1 peptidase T [Ancylomarina euxinus]RRG21175.1 peptidase T [Ancylomarina euxinus]
MTAVVDKFIKYVKFDTESDTQTGMTPSTPGQMVLAQELVKELEEMGMSQVSLDENGYVMAVLPSNIDKEVPTVGFISHMDTSPDFTGKHVKPQFVENYDGGDIVLNTEKNIIMKVSDFPDLKRYIGQTLITTNGTTLLGADDKAGVAEIMTAVEYLINHPEIKHGPVHIGFTPDEEIGQGADFFNVKKFGADFAYTLDGGELGELQFENFNAAYAEVTFKGRNVHPGMAKDKMINSMNIVQEFRSQLPKDEVPERTENYEGFYHLLGIEGSVENSKLKYIIRDFDIKAYEARKQKFETICKELQLQYGKENVILEMKDQYFNMREKIEPVKFIVDIAEQAMKDVGVTPIVVPIRGGTDGSRLSYMGLPCPNIFAGGHNFHGRFEYVPVDSMQKAVDVILKVVELISKR